MPHAIRSLWPISTPGTPGSVTPATFRPGACNCTAYHVAGIVNSRCGSLASMALPLFVRFPLTAQAFEPGVISPPLRMGNSRSTRSGSPSCSIRHLSRSCSHDSLSVRFIDNIITSESATLHGRG